MAHPPRARQRGHDPAFPGARGPELAAALGHEGGGSAMTRALLAMLILGAIAAASDDPVIEATDLARTPGLVGREVLVDGRVRYFLPHGERGYDELYLHGTPVLFRLPARLRPEHAPRIQGIQVRGGLRK